MRLALQLQENDQKPSAENDNEMEGNQTDVTEEYADQPDNGYVSNESDDKQVDPALESGEALQQLSEEGIEGLDNFLFDTKAQGFEALANNEMARQGFQTPSPIPDGYVNGSLEARAILKEASPSQMTGSAQIGFDDTMFSSPKRPIEQAASLASPGRGRASVTYSSPRPISPGHGRATVTHYPSPVKREQAASPTSPGRASFHRSSGQASPARGTASGRGGRGRGSRGQGRGTRGQGFPVSRRASMGPPSPCASGTSPELAQLLQGSQVLWGALNMTSPQAVIRPAVVQQETQQRAVRGRGKGRGRGQQSAQPGIQKTVVQERGRARGRAQLIAQPANGQEAEKPVQRGGKARGGGQGRGGRGQRGKSVKRLQPVAPARASNISSDLAKLMAGNPALEQGFSAKTQQNEANRSQDMQGSPQKLVADPLSSDLQAMLKGSNVMQALGGNDTTPTISPRPVAETPEVLTPVKLVQTKTTESEGNKLNMEGLVEKSAESTENVPTVKLPSIETLLDKNQGVTDFKLPEQYGAGDANIQMEDEDGELENQDHETESGEADDETESEESETRTTKGKRVKKPATRKTRGTKRKKEENEEYTPEGESGASSNSDDSRVLVADVHREQGPFSDEDKVGKLEDGSEKLPTASPKTKRTKAGPKSRKKGGAFQTEQEDNADHNNGVDEKSEVDQEQTPSEKAGKGKVSSRQASRKARQAIKRDHDEEELGEVIEEIQAEDQEETASDVPQSVAAKKASGKKSPAKGKKTCAKVSNKAVREANKKSESSLKDAIVQISVFKCCACNLKFATRDQLGKHDGEVHPRAYECEKCRAVFIDQEVLLRHKGQCDYESDSGKPDLKCEECEEEFKDQVAIERHAMTHETTRTFACTKCLQNFDKETDYEKHVEGGHESQRLKS